jgi:hypothetical protein
MKLWQVRFCRRLWSRLQDAAPEPWPWQRILSVGARQAFLHAVGIIALAVAAVIVLPLGWVYAFYQNLCALEDPRVRELRALIRTAKDQALLWPGQNHLVLTIMTLFVFFVFLDLAFGVMAVPYLLKWVLGIETVFTLSGLRLLNTTFLAVLTGLTYLCTDPVLKTVYVLRCYYGQSRQTGEDLRSALRPFLRAGLMVFLLWVCISSQALAAEVSGPDSGVADSGRQEYMDRLDRSIDTVLQQRRFAWRLPRETVPEAGVKPGWVSSTAQWVVAGVKALMRPVGRWFDAFMQWLKQKMPAPKLPEVGGGDYRGVIRWIFYALGLILAIVLAYWLMRWLMRLRLMPTQETGAAEPRSIDLSDERLTAEDLPLEQWLAMAQALLVRNDLRQALRALYLAVLAVLAGHRRLTIARYKSNRDYARELARHTHAEPELLLAFEWCVEAFERSWYGMHPVGRPQVDAFIDQQQRIADLVQRTA